jgi:predicted component of type VI protein secretion system
MQVILNIYTIEANHQNEIELRIHNYSEMEYIWVDIFDFVDESSTAKEIKIKLINIDL